MTSLMGPAGIGLRSELIATNAQPVACRSLEKVDEPKLPQPWKGEATNADFAFVEDRSR